MSREPTRLRELHVAILVRVYVLAGTNIPLDRLSEELVGRRKADDVSSTIGDLASAKLVRLVVHDDGLRITLSKTGQRNARMWLDAISLTYPELNASTTTTVSFLEYFERHRHGMARDLSRWQLWRLEWKWAFRRDWGPA